MTSFRVGPLAILGALAIGCASSSVTPEKTQLETREFQTRSYQTNDVKMVMKAVLNVLQDDGYIVKNANVDLGFLNASKEVDLEESGEVFMQKLLWGDNARWKKNSLIDATANVTEFGSECRVRANFQVKMTDNRGIVMNVQTIDDAKFYQDFFAKVDKGVFIQKEKL